MLFRSVEEQKMLQTLEDATADPAERASRLQDSMTRLIDLALDGLASSTEYIVMHDGTRVTNRQHILEFYQNCDAALVKTLQELVAEVNQQAGIPPMKVTCGHCNQPYKVPIEFNYSSFFANGS